MTIERDIARQRAARTLDELETTIGRTIHQTTNAFHSIVQQATAARAAMAEGPGAQHFTPEDLAVVDARIAALGQAVTDTAANLVAGLPQGE